MTVGWLFYWASFGAAMGLPNASERPGGSVIVEGIGRRPPGRPDPQARLMARRAAEADALRKLAWQRHGRFPAVIRDFRYRAIQERPDGTVRVLVESAPPRRTFKADRDRRRR